VPLRKEQRLLGAIVIYRREVRPFTDKQIALLQSFAAQAVIAMENARLLTETREALEQQTATAEVLQVINSSPGDLAPVFDALLDKGLRLCEASYGTLLTWDGERLHRSAFRGASVELMEALGGDEPVMPPPGSVADRLLRGENIIHAADITQDPSFAHSPRVQILGRVGGVRTYIAVPLRKDDQLLGFIGVYRREVRPFSDKQIALLQNFAAQAVVAMENARLIAETREALEQQTATAEVLQVINSSPGELVPVFDAILEKAHTLCEAEFGSLFLYDGEHFRAIASHSVPEALASRLREGVGANDSRSSQQLIAGAPFAHIHDTALEERALYRDMDMVSSHRTLLSVPLRKGDALLGMIVAGRLEVRPFTDKQIALLQNFAAQAVIAMENARLITETREALEQQTATAEVLGIINASPGDLTPVFDAMLEKTLRLCEAAHGNFLTHDGEVFHTAAFRGEPQFAEYRRQLGPLRPAEFGQLARVVQGGGTLHRIDQLSKLRCQKPLQPSDPAQRLAGGRESPRKPSPRDRRRVLRPARLHRLYGDCRTRGSPRLPARIPRRVGATGEPVRRDTRPVLR
jgi:GAF domain-containing protein